MAASSAGQIVIVDWRDALPKEPSELRPAIVVEDDDLFDPSYPNVILVPLTEDERLAIPELSLAIIRLRKTAVQSVAGCCRIAWRPPRRREHGRQLRALQTASRK